MSSYDMPPENASNAPPERATAQFEMMLHAIIRQTIARTSSVWWEYRLRRHPDNWLDDRLALIQREEVHDLLETVRLWGMMI